MTKKFWYVLVVVVIILLLSGAVIVFLLPVKKNQSTSSINKNTQTSLPQKGANPNTILPGQYIVSADSKSFMFVGQLDSVTKKSNGDIIADVSFATIKGQGQPTHHLFLISTRDVFFPLIGLTKAKILAFTVLPIASKVVVFDTTKQFDEALKALQTYQGQKAIFSFDTIARVPQKVLDKMPQIQRTTLQNLIACNASFLNALDTNTPLPSCTPYTYTLTVYDKNF